MSDAHLLIRDYYKCFNERRFADAAELFAFDAVIEHSPSSQSKRGPEGYLDSARAAVAAFPDLHLQIVHVEQRGDTICEVDLIGTGTHEGEWSMGTLGTFKATGRRTSIRIREMLEIRSGMITYSSLSWDMQEIVAKFSRDDA